MGLGIGQRTQSLVVFLTGGIPEGKLDRLAIYSTVGDVILEDGRDLGSWSAWNDGVE